MSRPPFVALIAAVVALIAACGSSMQPAPPAPDPRVIPPEILARRAIAYSGYRTGQSPDIQVYPSTAEIEQDLRLLVRGGWGLIRLFDSGPHAERVLQVIEEADLDLQVMLGIWIAGNVAEADAANRDQIERCVALVEQHGDHIALISVGNEALDDWSDVKLPPAELAAYITEVRNRVPQPVTTDDSWLPFALGRDGNTDYADVIEVARAVDFLSLHVYAFADAFYESWEWRQEAVPAEQRAAAMMAAAVAYTKGSVREVRGVLAAKGVTVPILLGEVGWKSSTPFTADDLPEREIERHLAGAANQTIFYQAIDGWVYGAGRDPDSPVGAFTFEAFDEPWKGEWGDDDWGLFDVERRPKCVLRDAFADLGPPDAATCSAAGASYYTAD
jgi:exo-beta-1,3-glucanase (GH17 family)